jgi:hypothetical protein
LRIFTGLYPLRERGKREIVWQEPGGAIVERGAAATTIESW